MNVGELVRSMGRAFPNLECHPGWTALIRRGRRFCRQPARLLARLVAGANSVATGDCIVHSAVLAKGAVFFIRLPATH
jgi:hypothetical protein